MVESAGAADLDRDVSDDGGRAQMKAPGTVLVTSDDESNDVGSSILDDSSDTTSSTSSTSSTHSRPMRLSTAADGGTPPSGNVEGLPAASSVPS